MSGIMSISLLLIDSKTTILAFQNWPRAWGIAMLVAFPVGLIITPFTNSFVSKIMIKKEKIKTK